MNEATDGVLVYWAVEKNCSSLITLAIPFLAFIPGVHPFDAFLQFYPVSPAEGMELRGVGELFHRAVGLLGVEVEVAPEADDLFDEVGEVFDGNIFAGADI